MLEEKNMKNIIKVCLFFSLILSTSMVFAQSIKFSLERMQDSKKISFLDVKTKLSCYPNLISHWNREEGFSNKLEVKYGDLRLVRTDIGDPDGNLFVYLKDKFICEIELNLMPDIYYNSKDKLLLIYGYGGSNHYIELFSLGHECKYIGWASLYSKNDLDELRINWYHQTDGSKVCHQ